MSSDRHPANANTPHLASGLWAAWPGSLSVAAAWSTLASAGLGNWLMLQEALVETTGDLMRIQMHALDTAPGADGQPSIDAFSAAVEDVRDCSVAVMQAQSDAIEAFRQSA